MSNTSHPARRYQGRALAISMCAAVQSMSSSASAQSLFINEIQVSTTGSDWEFVELSGAPGTPLSGLTLLSVEADAGSSSAGRVDSVVPIAGAIPDDGYWFAASTQAQNAYTSICGAADGSFADNTFENSTTVNILVSGFTGTVGDDIDVDNDGVIDNVLWSEVIDAVAIQDSVTDYSYGFTALGPDGSFLPSGVFRTPDEGAWSPTFLNFSSPDGTPGASNVTGCVTAPPPVVFTYIHDVQGESMTSPLHGQSVTVQGIVIADLQESSELSGFFVQEEITDEDDNPATSEGVFVYCGFNGCPDVAIGNIVTVTGNVDEFSGQTQLDNDAGNLSVVIEDAGNNLNLREPAQIDFPLSSSVLLESVEGMSVQVVSDMHAVEYFNFDRFGEIRVWTDGTGADRPYQVTQTNLPGVIDPAYAEELFASQSVLLDDGSSRQNIGKLLPLNADNQPVFGDAGFAPADPSAGFRGGDLFSGIEGVMAEAFGDYRIHISDLSNGSAIDGEAFDITIINTNPRDLPAEDIGGSLRVASFNVLNYFTTIDDGVNDICGGNQDLECRGADSISELERQQAKIVSALRDLDADIVGLIEIENTPGVSAAQTLADALNLVSDRNYIAINSGVVGTDAIKVDFIYDADTVAAVGLHAVLDSPAFVNPFNASIPRNRPAIAQTFEELATGGVITVVNNHLKSKGSGCGAGDDDAEQGSCNLTRSAAATELADWLATDPTNSGDPDYLVIGDLNSYAMEDPIMALKAAGFTDLAQSFIGESAYSYVFDGRWGTLDYALANDSLLSQVAGVTEWHINADEPDAIDYDESFNPSAWYETDGFRSSDHDPVVVGLSLIAVAKDKRECKDYGWIDLSKSDGSAFKNQGDCIQYVLTGK